MAWHGLVWLAIVLATLRIAGAVSPAFQAVAHVYVGLLVGVWIGSRGVLRGPLYLALALSAVEIACAVASRI